MASPLSSTKRRMILVVAIVSTLTMLTACLNSSQSVVLSELNADRSANRLGALRD